MKLLKCEGCLTKLSEDEAVASIVINKPTCKVALNPAGNLCKIMIPHNLIKEYSRVLCNNCSRLRHSTVNKYLARFYQF